MATAAATAASKQSEEITTKKNQIGITQIVVIAIILIIGAISFAGWKVYDNNKEEDKPTVVSSGPVKYVEGVRPTGPEITVIGSSSCLPHKDTTGPQTAECATAIKTNDGKYYGLIDPSQDYTFISKIDESSKVTGILVIPPTTEIQYTSEGSIYITTVE